MRWGLFFLAGVLLALYQVDGCLDQVRAWQMPQFRERALPHLQACARRQAIEFAGATVVLVGLYYASGWALARWRRGDDADAA